MTLGIHSRPRCAVVWCAVVAAASAIVRLLVPDLTVRTPSPDFEAVVVCAAAWALTLAAAWVVAVTTVVSVQVARSAPVPERGLPAPVRRLLLRACGMVLAGGLVAGAVAGPAAATPGSLVRDAGDRPASTSTPARTVPPPAGPRAASDPGVVPVVSSSADQPVRVTVRPGDSLWRIAEASLRRHGERATDADVAAHWPRIHDANRALVGPDPDFVRPGVPLVLPAPDPQET